MILPTSFHRPPDVTEYEELQNKLSLEQLDGSKSQEITTSAEFLKLQLLIDEQLKSFNYNNYEQQSTPEDWIKDHFHAINGKEEQWISLLEKIIPNICPHAVYFNFQHSSEDDKVFPPYNYLLALWASTALHLNSSVSKLIGVNVRALKAGLLLIKRLCNLSIDAVQNLHDFSAMDHVVEVILAQHIASSMKLLAITALDALTSWPHMMQMFLFGITEDHDDDNDVTTTTGYSRIIQFAMQSQTARVAVALTRLVRKAHVYECMHRIQDMTSNLALVKIPAATDLCDDDEDDDGFDEDDMMEEEDEGMVSDHQHEHLFDDDRKRTVSTASSSVRFPD